MSRIKLITCHSQKHMCVMKMCPFCETRRCQISYDSGSIICCRETDPMDLLDQKRQCIKCNKHSDSCTIVVCDYCKLRKCKSSNVFCCEKLRVVRKNKQ
jgi:hypothetical protein